MINITFFLTLPLLHYLIPCKQKRDFPSRPSLTCSVNDAFFYLFVRKHLEDVHQLVIEVDQRVKKRSYNRKNESSLDPVTGEVKNQQQRRPLSQNFISKHKEEKNNICQVCAKGFKSAQQLGRHMLIHTGEKPYQVSRWLQLVKKRDL